MLTNGINEAWLVDGDPGTRPHTPRVTDQTSVRVMRNDEFVAMRELCVAAFGGDERIGPLLDMLRESWAWEDALSFVAVRDGSIVGQVLYTHSFLDAPTSMVDVLVLSPLAVRPDAQNAGIGSQLVRESLAAVATRSEPLVFLEGDPDYYTRFGFRPGALLGFTAPSDRIPPDAFMVFPLPGFESWMTGALVYADAFWRTDTVGLR
jgi:putative acetyltransferase